MKRTEERWPEEDEKNPEVKQESVRCGHIVSCLRDLERQGLKILLWVGREGIVGKINA